MKWPLVTSTIEHEDDLVPIRQRTRFLAETLGLLPQDQTRIATAVSEIARNACSYGGGGRVEFGVDTDANTQMLVVKISDKGQGIADLGAVLEGRYVSRTGLGLGITGARRLCDHFEIKSDPGRGTVVTLGKKSPPTRAAFDSAAVADLSRKLSQRLAENPQSLMREQNRELLVSLAQLSEREEEAHRLNAELAETNRGVVALYAELEARAEQLRLAGELLEKKVVERTADLASANARLKAEALDRARTEELLRQSQKMEAVGQLTGGIAHDFNNLLTGVMGSLELMQRRLKQKRYGELERYANNAMEASSRAASLTHRLLAFARRQPLDPRAVDVNALLTSMADLLRRTVRERIRLDITLRADTWLTLCDPPQLENAILNLVINARDAMLEGGRLTIQTDHTAVDAADAVRLPGLLPGDYVTTCVKDTGTGMPPEVVARAFDPFFTTKPLGQGTGLGLSMIYGFARQSGGCVAIESEVGRGSQVCIYLPRYQGELVHEAELADGVEFAGTRMGGVVLLIEDETIVRNFVAEVLQSLGLEVLQAEDGPSGVLVLQSDRPIDLLVTDVGLPGMDGRKVADIARVQRPTLKILFMTGYAESAAIAVDFLRPGMEMITKPFSVDALARRVTHMRATP